MRVASLATALLVGVAVVQARDLDLARRPLFLRLDGHVGAPREGDRRIAELTFRRGNRTITFQLDEIRVLSGDAAGTDVLHEVEPYTPNMSVAGPREVVDAFEGASPADALRVTGYFRSGQRIFELSGVERATSR
jgi:hypothetical protein